MSNFQTRLGLQIRLIGISLVGLVLLSCTASDVDSIQDVDFNQINSPPKVILIIGDGMDDQQITIARNYLVGDKGTLVMDRMPYRGSVQIVAVSEDDPSKSLYVSDSANTATSMATGGITSPSRIATTPATNETLVTIAELALQNGFQAGLVTTSSLTDATPAAFASHINNRACHGPEEMISTLVRGARRTPVDCSTFLKANGGPGSIAEQMAASDFRVLLGGGSQYFEQLVEGQEQQSVVGSAVARGYMLATSKEALFAASTSAPLIGLFARVNLPVRLIGEDNAVAMPIDRRDGVPVLAEPFKCIANPAYGNTPSLRDMTEAALRQLNEDDGFFLMVESASIDKQAHARRPCGSIGELQQLNEALQLALDYAQSHPETLILVTADHGHSAQIVADPTETSLRFGLISPGYFARLITEDGNIIAINYATSGSPISQGHTGVQVPLYAYGPGHEEFPGFLTQPEIFDLVVEHLGLR